MKIKMKQEKLVKNRRDSLADKSPCTNKPETKTRKTK